MLVSAYIFANVISNGDGQILLKTKLFYHGIQPVINIRLFESCVSRVRPTWECWSWKALCRIP
jgi:F0F1-type ATP synthase alpha subunit